MTDKDKEDLQSQIIETVADMASDFLHDQEATQAVGKVMEEVFAGVLQALSSN